MRQLLYHLKKHNIKGVSCSDDGVFAQRNGKPKRICNFNFYFIYTTRYHYSENEILTCVAYLITFRNAVGGVEYKKGEVPINQIYCLRDLLLQTCPECFIDDRKGFLEFLSGLWRASANNLPISDIYYFSGWAQIDGRMAYLSASRADCVTDIFIPRGYSEQKETWKIGKTILELGRNKNNDAAVNPMVAILLYLMAAYCAKPMADAGLPLHFPLCVVGESGSLKTSVCSLLTRPFGGYSGLNLEATPAAISRYLSATSDRVFFLDDIFRQTPEYLEKVENVIRFFGDGCGRAIADASSRSNILRSEVRGGCVITGENSLNLQRSSRLRILEVEVAKNTFDTEILTGFQTDEMIAAQTRESSLLTRFFAGWIEFIERNYDTFVANARTLAVPDIKEITDRRLKTIFRQFLIVGHAFVLWGEAVGVIDFKETDRIFSNLLGDIVPILIENQQRACGTEIWQIFLHMLKQAIANKTLSVAEDKNSYLQSRNYYGYLSDDGEWLILEPERTFVLLVRSLTEQGVDVKAVRPAEIWKSFFSHGISAGYTGHRDGNGRVRNRYLRKDTVNGHQVERLVVNVAALEKI